VTVPAAGEPLRRDVHRLAHINLLPATVASKSDGVQLTLADGSTVIAAVQAAQLARGQSVEIGIRPEHLTLTSTDAWDTKAGATFSGEVTLVEQSASRIWSTCALPPAPNSSCAAARTPACGDDKASCRTVETIYVFDADGRSHERLFPEGPVHD